MEIPGVKTPAEVVSVGKDGTLQLKAGILKMKAKVDEVRLIEEDVYKRQVRSRSSPFRFSRRLFSRISCFSIAFSLFFAKP